jgi:hypothetical protein
VQPQPAPLDSEVSAIWLPSRDIAH